MPKSERLQQNERITKEHARKNFSKDPHAYPYVNFEFFQKTPSFSTFLVYLSKKKIID